MQYSRDWLVSGSFTSLAIGTMTFLVVAIGGWAKEGCMADAAKFDSIYSVLLWVGYQCIGVMGGGGGVGGDKGFLFLSTLRSAASKISANFFKA